MAMPADAATDLAVSLKHVAKSKNTKRYCHCFVPGCNNTSIKTPDKLFVSVPIGKRRKLWCNAARRRDFVTSRKTHCCEDHLHLSDDIENYVKVALTGCPIILKKGVVPSKFDCQPTRTATHKAVTRTGFLKRQRKDAISTILKETQSTPGEAEFPHHFLSNDTVVNNREIISDGDHETLDASTQTDPMVNVSSQTRRRFYRRKQIQVKPSQKTTAPETS